jgi:hypothetical protein
METVGSDDVRGVSARDMERGGSLILQRYGRICHFLGSAHKTALVKP